MAHEQFRQHGSVDKALSHLIEEMGEVAEALGGAIAAAGKTQRFGFDSVNPLIPAEERETNEEWIKRKLRHLKSEMDDLDLAIEKLEQEAGWNG